MDITRIDDKRRYTARVTVQADENGLGPVVLYNCTVRFGPAGWLTVVQGEGDNESLTLYPTSAVVAVANIEEVPSSGRVQVF